MRGLPDAAPGADGNVKFRRVVREAVVRHVISRGHVERRFRAEPAFLHRRAHLERDRPALAVKTSFETRHAHGAIGRADEILLAGPEQMDRRAAVRVRDHEGLLRLGPVAVAAKTAAQVAQVQVDVLLGDARDLRGAEARFLRALIADPDVDAIAGDEHRGVAGLHPRARQIRRRVGCFDNFGGASEGVVQIALIDAYSAGPIERGKERLAHVGGVERRMLRRNFPLDRHAIQRGPGLIPGVGNDGDAAAEDAAAGQRRIRDRELDGGAHARQLADRGEIVALDAAPIDRAGLHRRPFHARNADVDPVDGAALDLGRHIEILPLGPHQRPLVRRLDRDRLRIRMRRPGGAAGDLPISRRAAALGMRDDAVFGGQLGRRHAPELRGGQQQSLPRLGAGKLQVVPPVLNR